MCEHRDMQFVCTFLLFQCDEHLSVSTIAHWVGQEVCTETQVHLLGMDTVEFHAFPWRA